MTPTISNAESASTIRVEDEVQPTDVDALAALVDRLADSAAVVVELSRARTITPFALVQLQQLVTRHVALGHRVLLRGLTLSQSRLIELALRAARVPSPA
ncbi:MAG: hypothetical protein JST54_33290 [Deltaproteobacteria bacterium]|nr:hypothetical protein [Deltaproteobacteria bacterium]